VLDTQLTDRTDEPMSHPTVAAFLTHVAAGNIDEGVELMADHVVYVNNFADGVPPATPFRARATGRAEVAQMLYDVHAVLQHRWWFAVETHAIVTPVTGDVWVRCKTHFSLCARRTGATFRDNSRLIVTIRSGTIVRIDDRRDFPGLRAFIGVYG
jgi:ketosteroid isomerase-like protein